MKVVADCIPCYLKQVISACRAAGLDDAGQQRLQSELFPVIAGLDPARTPAENSTLVLLEAYRLLGRDDPFKEAKAYSNRLARTFLPSLERIVEFSEDPLLTALKVSVAGNVIDMGINPEFDVNDSIRQVLDRGFARCDMEPLRALIRNCGSLVVIGDNSGEIVFDFLLLAGLRQYAAELYYVVKGGPILNDATLEDAESAGIDMLAKVVTTGSNYLGLIPEYCGEPLRSLLANAGLVLAKGQANYETLEGTALAGDRTFFLLRMKCPCVASHLGVELGDSVLARNRVGGGVEQEKSSWKNSERQLRAMREQ
jgi:uncharacterized protein with ATP-grasp and redox domains